MNFFRKKNFTLNKSERTLVSCILNAAREALATPLHLPSIEQVKIKPNAPFGSQQMILLYLELFLITLEQNYLQLDAKPPERKRHFPLATPIELSDTKAQRIEEIIQYMQFCICEQLNTNQICQHFSMSRSSLQKLFQKEKGCPVSARTALIFVIDLIFFTAKLDMYDSVVITNQIVTAH